MSKKYYVVSADKAGTYMGEILGDGALPGFVRLRARHLWAWEGALSAAQLGLTGPTGGRITDWAVVEVQTIDICRLVHASDAAMAALARCAVWTP